MSIGMVITKGPGVWLGAFVGGIDTDNETDWYAGEGWIADELEFMESLVCEETSDDDFSIESKEFAVFWDCVEELVHNGCTVEFFPCGRLEGTGA